MQPSDRIRLVDFKREGRGDFKLRIQVHIPEKLSAGERALYGKLRALTHSRQ
jgi:DnaJ-class molecular chaperone